MCVPVYIYMCSIVSVHVESEEQYKLSLLLTPFFFLHNVSLNQNGKPF